MFLLLKRKRRGAGKRPALREGEEGELKFAPTQKRKMAAQSRSYTGEDGG
jgi:hypothetical protein